MYIQINGTHYKFSRVFAMCAMVDVVYIYDEHDNYVTHIPYDRDWYEVAKIALTQIQRRMAA